MKFRDWCEQNYTAPEKPWKGKQEQILKFWQTLPPSIPIQPVNVPTSDHKGSTYMYDGIRVTGSQQFINSVISRLKDVTNYNNENTELMLRYYQQVDKNTEQPLPNSFVFYAQLRGKKNAL